MLNKQYLLKNKRNFKKVLDNIFKLDIINTNIRFKNKLTNRRKK